MYTYLLQGIGLGLLLTVSVGPVIFAALNISMRLGHRPGYAFVSGVSLSDVVLVLAGNMAAELVRSLLKFESLIAMLGGLLLMAMAAVLYFFIKDPKDDHFELKVLHYRKRDLLKFTLQGFLVNTLNPGSIIFWITTCTAFAFMPLNNRLLLFGSCLATILLVDVLKVYFAAKLRKVLTPRNLHRIHQFTAVILALFGLALFISSFF